MGGIHLAVSSFRASLYSEDHPFHFRQVGQWCDDLEVGTNIALFCFEVLMNLVPESDANFPRKYTTRCSYSS